MKEKEKKEAIRLRKEGLSTVEIAKRLNVAKSSVCVWVKDVILTPEQIHLLSSKYRSEPTACALRQAQLGNQQKHLALRKSYQEIGMKLAEKYTTDKDFVAGCMLYWGEGCKKRNSLYCKF